MIKNLIQKNHLFPITLLMFTATYTGATDIINSEDLIGLVIYFFIITSLQYILIQAILKNYFILKNIAFAFALFANAQMTVLDFIPEFSAMKAIAEISAILTIIILFYFLSVVVSKSNKALIILPSISIFSLIILLVTFLSYSTVTTAFSDTIHGSVRKDVGELTFNPKFNDKDYDISFADKPDIILLSFEALIPESKWRMQTKRPAQIPIHMLIEKNMQSFKNHFSDELSTLFSISSMFSLTPDLYHQLEMNKSTMREMDERFGVVSGKTPSPLKHILRKNGYEISTFTEMFGMWGKNKGPYVDHYDIPPLEIVHSSTVCRMFGARTGAYSFWAYCIVRDKLATTVTDMFAAEGHDSDPSLVWETEFGTEDMNWYLYYGIKQAFNQLKELIERSDNTDRPQFLFSHINWPDDAAHGYTPNWRNKSDGSFRWFVLAYERKAKISAHLLNQVINLFKDRKRDTIIYIFGDHGMSLATNLKWDQDTFEDQRFSWTADGDFILGDERFDLKKLVQDDPEETIRIFDESSLDKSITYTRDAEPYRTVDMYGSYGGLYSDHRCAKFALDNNLKRGYQTPQLVMHSLISCLADVKSKASNSYINNFKREYTIKSQNWHADDAIITHNDYVKFDRRKYTEFLYE